MEQVPSEKVRERLELVKKLRQATNRLFRQHAPQARESARRLRFAIIRSLSQPSRGALAEAIGEFVVADALNWDGLIKRIDVIILTPAEREKGKAAYSVWLAEQATVANQIREELSRQVPELMQPRPSSDERSATTNDVAIERERETQDYVPQPSMASSTLVGHLLVGLDDVSWETPTREAEMARLFKFSGPDDVTLRACLRNSVLEAIAAQRRQVGKAIGRAAVSATLSGTSLSQELNMILTADERRSILAAFELFAERQRATKADFARRRPEWELDEPPGIESGEPPDPGAFLWRALLTRGVSVKLWRSVSG